MRTASVCSDQAHRRFCRQSDRGAGKNYRTREQFRGSIPAPQKSEKLRSIGLAKCASEEKGELIWMNHTSKRFEICTIAMPCFILFRCIGKENLEIGSHSSRPPPTTASTNASTAPTTTAAGNEKGD